MSGLTNNLLDVWEIMLVNSFNHFRAIAIIFIIAGHSFGVNGMTFDTVFNTTIQNLIAGGTALFVFISGFLFHHIFYKRYEYKKFMFSKVKNVFTPYFLLGLIPVIMYTIKKSDAFNGYFLPIESGFISEYLIPFLKYYTSGRFLTAYWYIPFIMLTFLLSPLHIKYIKLKFNNQLLIITTFSIIALLIHRPVYNINVIQSVIYFTPIYLIGITASIHKELIYEYLKGKEVYIILAVILLATYQSTLGIGGNYHKDPFTYGGIDLMFFQKILLCFFFMVFLNRFESNNNKAIHAVASTSFTAFFIHPFIIFFITKLELGFMAKDSWFLYFAFVLTISATCVLIAKITKKIIPKYSRFIIGY
ncbi:acyltransferase family protein [Pseudoalteromonas sp. T1lg76]|uniref:acyltransferase family protein n=1 Tax=Pseudoalteromonas sp. T1lg76 TaxID=2077103 RepID=UPI0018F870EE|nr:acyltransferase [Pseudoalteromonas sp. T1lg76]